MLSSAVKRSLLEAHIAGNMSPSIVGRYDAADGFEMSTVTASKGIGSPTNCGGIPIVVAPSIVVIHNGLAGRPPMRSLIEVVDHAMPSSL